MAPSHSPRWGKSKSNAIRLIRARITEAGEWGPWGLRNFAHTLYIDPQNGPAYPMFTMTKAGKRVLISPVAGCATPLRDDGGR